MNFLSKKWIPAALFAGVTSVVVTAPAQALSLKGSVIFDDVVARVSNDIFASSDGTATFNFIGGAEQEFSFGDFDNGDTVMGVFGPLVINAGSLISTANPFLTDIDTDSQGPVDFVLTSISSYSELVNNGTKSFEFALHGYFTNGSTVEGNGVFDGRITVDSGGDGKFGGSLKAVPTPAAVLPVLGGLFGFASKRKREAEGNA